MRTENSFDFIVNKSNLSETELANAEPRDISAGEVRLIIERFALTSNNVTYGVAGDMLGYWQFFPVNQDNKQDWGRIPVWGIATVANSHCEGIEVGSRYYGYYPMSDHLIVAPIKLNAFGFSDGAKHRQSLSPIYNQYSLMTEETGFPSGQDNHQIIYKPLFMTSFLIDDYMFDNDFFGAEQVILSSASSKTAFGTAYCLKERGKKVVGISSDKNRGFVESLGIYDAVITYDDVSSLDASLKSVYIDMSGNRKVLGEVHHHFQDNLVNSCGVGITHWDAMEGEDPQSLPGAKPTMFFAPTQAQKRSKEWGAEGLQNKLGNSWNGFIEFVEKFVSFNESNAPTDISKIYQILINGPSPDQAYILKISD